METKKLRRSLQDSVIGGVAGGLGEYFGTDPVIFRILFIVLTFTGGGGVLIYLLMWIFIPKAELGFVDSTFNSSTHNTEPEATDPFEEVNVEGEETKEDMKEDLKDDPFGPKVVKKKRSKNGNIIGGALLIMVGLFFLADDFFPWLSWEYLWPAALIIVGLAIIKMNFKGKDDKNDKNEDHGKS